MDLLETIEAVAARNHKNPCDVCGRQIKKGCYFKSFTVVDGEIYTVKLCSRCSAWEDRYFRDTRETKWMNDDLLNFRRDVLRDYLDSRHRRVMSRANL